MAKTRGGYMGIFGLPLPGAEPRNGHPDDGHG